MIFSSMALCAWSAPSDAVFPVSAVIASVVSFLAHPIYIFSIIRGKTIPHPFTWIASVVLSGITLHMFFCSGGGWSGLMLIGDFIGFLVISILSIVYWEKSRRKFSISDTIIFIGALMSIGVYLYFDNSVYGLIAALIAEVLAIIPTIKKAYENPDEEDLLAWTFTFAGDAINILAIKTIIDTMYVMTVYAIDGLVWSIIYARGRR